MSDCVTRLATRHLQWRAVLGWLQTAVPPLDTRGVKGRSGGTVCVVGGSKEYTGGPFFAAISALHCGADLVHVICPSEAATVIKSYSPELIVHPILGSNREECFNWLSRMHAVVFGPGLGRDNVSESVELIKFIRNQDIPLVIDADGLHVIGAHPSIISGYKKAILTPNINEARMLYQKTVSNEKIFSFGQPCCTEIANNLGSLTVVMKGVQDVITDGVRDIVCTIDGSPRRCGGQGDLLSGTMGLMLSWCHKSTIFTEENDNVDCQAITAAYGACFLTRTCAKMAFEEKQRAMITSNMIEMIGKAFIDMVNLPTG